MMTSEAAPVGLGDRAVRHAAVLTEALQACARVSTRAQLFAGLDALAAGPLGALGVTLFLGGSDRTVRVVHTSGAGRNTVGAQPAPAFAQLVTATIASGAPLTVRALATLPGASQDPRTRAMVAAGVQAVAFIPCSTPRTAPGVLSVRYGAEDALDEAEVNLLRDVALLAALCIERVDAATVGEPTTLGDRQLRQHHLAQLGELVPAVIHDLNNPLTGISAFAELLEAELTEPDQVESVGYIRREAMQAARLLRDLQLLARASGAATLVDLNPLVESAVRLRGYLVRSAGATLRVALEPGVPPVQGDAQALLQLIMQLLARAEGVVRDVDPASRIVEIATAREPHVAVLRVTDTGPGMSPEALGRMFDWHPVGAPAPLASVGLAIAKAIVEANGGTMAVDGGPDKPTRIEVRLPLPPIADSRSPASR